MNTKNPVKKIGASLFFTLALMTLIYLLLPNGRSGAAPRLQPPGTNTRALAASVRADQKQMRKTMGQSPLSFEMNHGQFDPQVRFASRGADLKAFLTQSEAVFVLRKPGSNSAAQAKPPGPLSAAQAKQLRDERSAQRAAATAVVRMSLVGANAAPSVSGLEELPGKINYFRGSDEKKWIAGVPTFRKVSFAAVYPGIDLVYYGKGSQLEYDLVVGPGANPSQIAFNFDGAERLEVDAATGALIVHAAGGAQMRQAKPLIYQELNGSRRAISGGFTTEGNRAGFSVGDYDKSRPLIIDPAIITYATYLGGEDDDLVHDIAADADGNAYAVGMTQSALFPTKDAYQPGRNAFTVEAFVTKFNADGSELIWSTYLGGGQPQPEEGVHGDDGAYAVALDGNRNVYVTGWTLSADFPTRNAMQTHLADACCGTDSFITKLNPAGDQLVFSTYFGGASGDDVGRGIAVDKNNNVYVVGYTSSFAFPTTHPIQGEINGRTLHADFSDEQFDAYLAKIDASGQFRVYSTYIGGPGNDAAFGVAVDAEGAAYVTGSTLSTEPDPIPDPSATPTEEATPAIHFPITDNAFQKDPGGSGETTDAFVTKVNPAGTEYIYSTYLGGIGDDIAWGIALGADRSAYVTGYTNSSITSFSPNQAVGPIDFPTTANAFQQQNNGGFDAFLTRLKPDGSDLIYSTLIGGEANEGDGPTDCFACIDRFDGAAVAVDLLGNAYITGWTDSTVFEVPSERPNGPAQAPIVFPTKDAFQPFPGSLPGSSPTDSRDAFVSMFNTNASGDDSLVYSSFLGGSRTDEGQAIGLDAGGNPVVGGWTQSDCPNCDRLEVSSDLNDFPFTTGHFQEEPSGFADGWVVSFAGGSATIGQILGFTISGQVTTEGDPVEGVTITLDKPNDTSATTTTDAQGIYSFPGLSPNSETPYTVTPSGLGFVYDPASAEVIITNKNERADFVASFPEPEPTPSASPTATATATATATPTAVPVSQPVNLSTRLNVLTGDQVGIGGFIITGSGPKHVIVRAIGPDLTRFGIPNPLPDPVLELHGPGAFATITNNNWRDTQETQIKATGLAPTNDLESAIDAILAPGNYTGIIRGNGGSTGIGLIEVYDLDTAAASRLSNISTRGFVGSTPGDAIIAGFILGSQSAPDRIVIRGLGPSLNSLGVPNTLQNPTLELHNGDGVLLFTNNDWQDNPTNAAEVAAAGLAPSNNLESAIAVTLSPGAYTAILAGLGNTTGNGLIEIYDRGAAP